MIKLKNSLILAAVSIVTIFPSHAGWELVHEDGVGQIFLLPDSVTKTGPSNYKFWTLINSSGPLKKGQQAKSSKVQMELSCSRAEIRIAYIAEYTEVMGKGKQVQSFEVPRSVHDFQPVIPGEKHEPIYRRLCKG